jgi:hypothetical protein
MSDMTLCPASLVMTADEIGMSLSPFEQEITRRILLDFVEYQRLLPAVRRFIPHNQDRAQLRKKRG